MTHQPRSRSPRLPPLLTDEMVSTTNELPGYRIIKSHGVVRGLSVRSRSVVGSIVGGVESFFGGNIVTYASICERSRGDAYAEMMLNAKKARANAIVGMRYDATEIMPGISEVLCYGTAVTVEVAPA